MAKLTIQELVKKIVDAVQAQAKKILNFDNGAIRLLFVPKCGMADDFLGGFGPNCEIDFGFPIKKGTSHIRPAKWRGKEDRKECDCYGIAALKIAGCAFALRNNLGRRSSDMPTYAITLGRINDRGCVVYEIFISNRYGIPDHPPYRDYMRIYVAVSGAMGDEDEQCALAAGRVIQQWCDTELDDDGFGHFEKYLSLSGPEFIIREV